MKRILQVLPALDAGGVERTTLEIAEALVRAGAGALVASQGGRLEPELARIGAEHAVLPLASKNPLVIHANAGRLAALARARNVALIHARSRAPAWSALWAARRLKLPFVTTYHGIYNAKTPWKRAYNAVMAKGDLVIANSHYTRAHVIAAHGLAPERVIAIPRGVDLGRFNPEAVTPERVAALRSAWGLPPEPGLVLLLAARLTRWKGQALAIAALARVLAARPNAVALVLAGDSQGRSAYVQELEAHITAAGLGARVRIVGHVEDVPAALSAADIALAPSLEPEAFGRAAIEAQAMARPVIAADHGGLAETTIAGETGLLTPPGNVAALAHAIERMIDLGPEGRAAMGARARARTQGLYAVETLQKETLRVYERLIGVLA